MGRGETVGEGSPPMKVGLAFFAVVWIGFVMVADGAVTYSIRTAIRSADWVPTDGVVTRSELKFGRKRSVSLDLAYSYTVDGVQYTGREYQFGPAALPSAKWRAVQADLLVGKRVTVHFDPDDPDQSVMNPGVKPDVLIVLLTLTPFNLIAVGFGWMCWGQLTGRRAFDPARHVRPTADGYAARLNGFGPLAVFGFTLLGVSFVGIFLVALVLHSWAEVPVSWAVDGGIWAGILAVCGVAAWRGGKPRLWIEQIDLVKLPTTTTGREMVEVPRTTIRDVRLDTTIVRTKGKPRTVHVISLIWVDIGERQVTRFAEYADRRDADTLTEWVRERLGLVAEAAA